MTTQTAIPEATKTAEVSRLPGQIIKPSLFKQEMGERFGKFHYKNWVVYQIIKMMAINGDQWVPFTQRTLIKNLDPESDVGRARACLDILADEDKMFERTKNVESDNFLETDLYTVNQRFFDVMNPPI